jgi:hypothetical protein
MISNSSMRFFTSKPRGEGRECRLTTRFSGDTPALQHAGVPEPVAEGRGSPAAEHFMVATSAATQSQALAGPWLLWISTARHVQLGVHQFDG